MPKDDLVARLRGWADEDREGPFSHHKRIQFEAAAAIEALRAEVEGLREDAERYRLLKTLDRGAFMRIRGASLQWAEADAAIDAARMK